MKEWKIHPIPRHEVHQLTKFIHMLLEHDFNEAYTPEVIVSYTKVFSESYFRKIYAGKHIVLGAYHGSVLIGIFVLKYEFGGVGFIEWIGVKTEYRKEGIASALISDGERRARALHIHYMYLFTEVDRNITFYQNRGFHYIGKHEGAWFGATEHLLSKRIHSEPFREVFREKH